MIYADIRSVYTILYDMRSTLYLVNGLYKLCNDPGDVYCCPGVQLYYNYTSVVIYVLHMQMYREIHELVQKEIYHYFPFQT